MDPEAVISHKKNPHSNHELVQYSAQPGLQEEFFVPLLAIMNIYIPK